MKITEDSNSKVAMAYYWAEKDCDTFLLKKIYVKGFMRGIEECGNVNNRKIGEWIPCGDIDAANNQDFRCSCCGSGDVHAVNVSVPFCWKCGAIMKNEKSKQTI